MKFRTHTMGLATWAAGLVLALMMAAAATPASAQATRTWVSGVGDDANPCSRTAPCKTFAGAISKTAPAGEIDCLDPAGFGAVTITKSMTIECSAFTGGVLVQNTNGIVVNVATTDNVILKGLDINGTGPAIPGLDGIKMIGAGNLTVMNCVIYGFRSANSNGVNLVGANTAHVLVENTIIRANTNGVNVAPTGGTNAMIVDRSTLENNITANVVTVTGGTVVLAASTIAGTPTALSNTGGSIISYGNNFIRNTGTPSSTVVLQ